MNENEVTAQVFTTLKSGTETIRGLMADRDKVLEKINSGVYGDRVVNGELWPKANDLKRKAEEARAEAMKQARALVEGYRQAVERDNALDGSKLTDDARLLAPGIAGTLTKDDYMSMLERNGDNTTMTKLIMRTAKANGVDLGRVYVGGMQELAYASALDRVTGLYEKWMAEPNGLEMLNKFLPGYNENE